MHFLSPNSPAQNLGNVAPVVDRNIQALLERRRREQREQGLQERIANKITAFTGSMPFVYLHLLLYGAWIIINLGWTPLTPFDPTFVVLAMVASVEAIFLSTFVLITQNQLAAAADRRADLNLQISLLSEHEITQIIHLIAAIAERLEIPCSTSELEELTQDVHPEEVLNRIEQGEKQSACNESSSSSHPPQP